MKHSEKSSLQAFLDRHEYLNMYVTFNYYTLLSLGPIMLIGGLIDSGWTTDALIPFGALLIMSLVGLPLILLILALFFGAFTS